MEAEPEIEAIELIYPALVARLDEDGLSGFSVKVCTDMELDESRFVELVVLYPEEYPAEHPRVRLGESAGISNFMLKDLERYIDDRVAGGASWDQAFPFEFIEYTMSFLEGNLQQSPANCVDDDDIVLTVGGRTETISKANNTDGHNSKNGAAQDGQEKTDLAHENEVSALPGDPVTPENFERWWRGFVESGAADWMFREREQRGDRLTGRQLWMRGELEEKE